MNARIGAVVFLLALLATAAVAEEPGERRVTLGGFGSLGLVYHEEEGLEYRRNTSQPTGAEAGKLDAGTDTLAGIQLNAAWSRNLELVGQAVTRRTADNDWMPEVTRAFMRYDLSQAGEWRLGRIGLELFPGGDSQDIRYAELAIRPPVEVFGFIPSGFFDGAAFAVVRQTPLGVLSARAYGGGARGKAVLAEGSINDLAGSKVWGGHVQDAFGAWVLRVGAGVYELDALPDVSALVTGLRQAGEPQAAALAGELAIQDRTAVFLAGGIVYDAAAVQARLFLGRVQADGLRAPTLNAAMATGGYRIGRFTPYGLLSAARSEDAVRSTGLPDTPEYAALNAGAYAVQAALRYGQTTAALGLRYELAPRVALSAQVDQVWVRDSAVTIDRRGAPRTPAEMTVYGLALDFLY